MASNRLTREQVEDLYRTNKLSVSFEPTKVDDIIEIMNHFICTKEIVNMIMEPLSPSLIRRYHYCLTYGTYADKKHQIGVGEYRKGPNKLGVPATQISKKLDELISTYEGKKVDFNAILDFHVRLSLIFSSPNNIPKTRIRDANAGLCLIYANTTKFAKL